MSIETEEESKERCRFEHLRSQIMMLKSLIVVFFLLGAASVGLLVAHLWHDAQAFNRLNDTVNETKAVLDDIKTDIKNLHPESRR